MAKRLTKALREKRRWLGVLVGNELQDRKTLEARLASNAQLHTEPLRFRLMDFHPSEHSDVPEDQGENTPPSPGRAILRVPLQQIQTWRTTIGESPQEGIEGIYCVTTSGKIRLVRERLNIQRPPRKGT